MLRLGGRTPLHIVLVLVLLTTLCSVTGQEQEQNSLAQVLVAEVVRDVTSIKSAASCQGEVHLSIERLPLRHPSMMLVWLSVHCLAIPAPDEKNEVVQLLAPVSRIYSTSIDSAASCQMDSQLSSGSRPPPSMRVVLMGHFVSKTVVRAGREGNLSVRVITVEAAGDVASTNSAASCRGYAQLSSESRSPSYVDVVLEELSASRTVLVVHIAQALKLSV
mmetsp:Transcript_7400/g.14904  ORF Transcript_7400/g.14904 Transcript_7400/m.14904 type:complete len:219 (-) Transcript_7400:1164-1820(-)